MKGALWSIVAGTILLAVAYGGGAIVLYYYPELLCR